MLKKTLFLVAVIFSFAIPNFAQIDENGVFTMSLPTINWAMQMDLKGFTLKGMELTPDGENQQMLAFNKEAGVTISAFLEKADHPGDAKECREYYWAKGKKSPIKKKDIKLSELNGVPVVEYRAVEYEGLKYNQKHINAYYSKDGYWIDIHISKMLAKEGDPAPFEPILNSVKLIDTYKHTLGECLRYGSIFYLAKDYKNAIIWYQKVYDMEQKERKLDISFWRMMVDNLGMAYGMTGDIKKSREIYEAAIPKDPEYCAFYYSLACGYAEEDDFENAMLNLEKAIKFQDNQIKGEKFPDPTTDSSFKKYVKNERFKELVKKIKR